MKRLFIDTSALVALKDSGDAHYAEALRFFEPLLSEGRTQFLLTNYVLSEVHAYFCRTPAVALAYVEMLRSQAVFKILRSGPNDERGALEILRSAADKTYSFADAVSFAVMRRLDIKSAFAFDRHFRQRGTFEVVP